MSAETMTPAAVAERLRRIAKNLRDNGDVQLVALDADGVAPANITLADEIWLAAFQLDGQFANDERDLA